MHRMGRSPSFTRGWGALTRGPRQRVGRRWPRRRAAQVGHLRDGADVHRGGAGAPAEGDDTSPQIGLLLANRGSSPEPENLEQSPMVTGRRFLDRNRGSAGAVRRLRDFAEEGIDGAEERLLIAAGELMEALESAQESAVGRKKDSALQARYHRVKRHRGHQKAVVAVGHQMLEIAYYVMRDDVSYHELGADYLDRRHEERAARRHVRQLEALGFQVTITKAA